MLRGLEKVIRACRTDPRGFVQVLVADLNPDQLDRLAELLSTQATLKRQSAGRPTRAFRGFGEVRRRRTVNHYDLALLKEVLERS
jgi:hypothetical protein